MNAADQHDVEPSQADLAEHVSLLTYVQMARGLRYWLGELRLVGLAPSTVWLLRGTSPRLGHVATGTFLDLWLHEGADASRTARLSLLDPAARLLGDPVLRLKAPRIAGDGLVYDVVHASGLVPERSGACVLFVDPAASDEHARPSSGSDDAATVPPARES